LSLEDAKDPQVQLKHLGLPFCCLSNHQNPHSRVAAVATLLLCSPLIETVGAAVSVTLQRWLESIRAMIFSAQRQARNWKHPKLMFLGRCCPVLLEALQWLKSRAKPTSDT
jgi:hypothetical protein